MALVYNTVNGLQEKLISCKTSVRSEKEINSNQESDTFKGQKKQELC
jgi:hypothetical protein